MNNGSQWGYGSVTPAKSRPKLPTYPEFSHCQAQNKCSGSTSSLQSRGGEATKDTASNRDRHDVWIVRVRWSAYLSNLSVDVDVAFPTLSAWVREWEPAWKGGYKGKVCGECWLSFLSEQVLWVICICTSSYKFLYKFFELSVWIHMILTSVAWLAFWVCC